MICFYKVEGKSCFSDLENLPFEKIGEPEGAKELFWLFGREAGSCRASFRVSDRAFLKAGTENVSWLDKNHMDELADSLELPGWVDDLIAAGKVTAVNVSHPRFRECLTQAPGPAKKRVNVLAIGDVGSMLLTGLHLLGGDVISEIAGHMTRYQRSGW